MKKLFLAVNCLILSACVPMQPKMEPMQKVPLRCSYPLITPLPETKELQSKSGINISIAPENFKCSKGMEETSQEVPSGLGDSLQLSLMGVSSQESGYYKLVETSKAEVLKAMPNKVAYRVKINNQMSRVFRGSGTVVLYNFGGRNTSISTQDYAELSNIIIPPRTESEITIYGPSFQDIPERTTLGLFLYDVVTKTDNAGNIVEKQNFEWYYNYQLQTKEELGNAPVKTKNWVRR